MYVHIICSPYSHLAIRPYPSEFTKQSKLKDGTEVLLRPIKPEDEPMWHDLLTLDAVGAGLSLNIATGEGNDIAVLYDIATEDVWISMEAGDDMVLAGEFDCSNVKILGGTDTWTRADSFNRLAGDVVIHVDIFEISEFDIFGSSSEFENELSLLDDVMDTPLEDALNEIESNLGL
jgi:hypothetical protein